MTNFHKVVVTAVQWFLKIYLGSGIYKFWSSIHRFLFDGKWKNVELPKYDSMDDVVRKIETFKWKQDGATELFDAICTPQKVQAVGFDKTSPHGNDCDEEAIWNSNVISNSIPFKDPVNFWHTGLQRADFFTVTWFEVKDPGTTFWSKLYSYFFGISFSGHNVCLLTYDNGYRYLDYSFPSNVYKTVDEVAQLVINTYAGWDSTGHGTKKGERLVYCVADKDLNVQFTKIG